MSILPPPILFWDSAVSSDGTVQDAPADTSTNPLLDCVSGYGRELFVSNILYFISKYRCRAMANALSGLLGYEYPEYYNWKKEHSHTDLSLLDESGSVVMVIENKCRDIARLNQLKRYSILFPHAKCLLISPLSSDRFIADKIGWEYISYSTIANALISEIDASASFEDCFLTEALKYMIGIESENDTYIKMIGDDVTVGRFIGLCMAYGKRKRTFYSEIVNKANKILYSLGRDTVVKLSGQIQSPIAEFDVEISSECGGEECSIIFMFQDAHFSFGLSTKSKFHQRTRERKQRTQIFTGTWNRLKGTEVLSTIVLPSFPGFRLPEKIQRGYLGNDYIMPTIHLPYDEEMSVGEVARILADIAGRAMIFT